MSLPQEIKNGAESILLKNGIKDFDIEKIAGDASFRSYYRVWPSLADSDLGKSLILMHAPKEHEDVDQYIKIDEFLVKSGFSAPNVIDIDNHHDFVLLEDLGDDLYSRILSNQSESLESELKLYENACDCLIDLHRISLERVEDTLRITKLYNNMRLFKEVLLFIDWYLPHQKGINLTREQRAEFSHIWFELFDKINKVDRVLVLRDFHADNLLMLKNRKGIKQVGLLDFQDALVGSRAYDLVSILEDARRDVSDRTKDMVLARYLHNSGCSADVFMIDYQILSLQRNIKILGIFARLSKRDGKHRYLNFLPRVEKFVIDRLDERSDILSPAYNFMRNFF